METHELHTAELQVGQTISVKIKREDGTTALSGVLGYCPVAKSSLPQVEPTVDKTDNCITFTWNDFGTLKFQHDPLVTKEDTGHKYSVSWELIANAKNAIIPDSYSFEGSHWYGGTQVFSNQWPLEKWNRKPMAYVAGDSFADQYGGVQERYWLNSNGAAIFVDNDVPLFVSMNNNNDKQLSFISKWNSPYKNVHNKQLFMKYVIIHGTDVRKCHEHVLEHVFSKPSGIPDELMFRYPIWSTWAIYKKNVSHDVCLKFADEIKENGFNASQFEIDDDWTPYYGDMVFDTKKFPDAKATINALKEKGYRVTFWVHPFCSLFSSASSQNCWCRSGPLPGITTWWNGVGKLLDVTNPEAVKWFSKSLKDLQEEYGITSYKFDAGEVSWLPKFCRTHEALENPNTFTIKYIEMCHAMDPDLRALEVRVATRTQHLPIWVRIMDKDSNWGWNNGLKTLIPHVLTFSIIGYPFVLPDMIGGNAYPHPAFPEKELFIRWLQANVFFPSLQFSIAPWQYDEEVVRISRKMTTLHENHADLLIELAKESTITGAPIVRPVWWIAPNDEHALTVDDEYLVGNDLLVAPVLEKGAMSRDVYLPAGRWRSQTKDETLEGGQWHKDYPAKLDELPWFLKVTESNNTE